MIVMNNMNNMNKTYGFNTQQYEDNENMPANNVVIYLDMARVLEAYSQGMNMAFQMGRQARADELCLVPNQNVKLPPLTTAPAATRYIGAYDRYAYGVYDDQTKYNNSAKYWDSATLNTCVFGNYDDALAYALNGISTSNGIPVETLPPLARKINWRQPVGLKG